MFWGGGGIHVSVNGNFQEMFCKPSKSNVAITDTTVGNTRCQPIALQKRIPGHGVGEPQRDSL